MLRDGNNELYIFMEKSLFVAIHPSHHAKINFVFTGLLTEFHILNNGLREIFFSCELIFPSVTRYCMNHPQNALQSWYPGNETTDFLVNLRKRFMKSIQIIRETDSSTSCHLTAHMLFKLHGAFRYTFLIALHFVFNRFIRLIDI